MQTFFHFCQNLYLSSFKLSQQFDVWSITGQSATDFSLLLTRCICVGGGFFIHTCTTENQGCYNWMKLLKNFLMYGVIIDLQYYSGTPLIRPPLGRKKSGRINRVALTRVVLQENVWQFLPGNPKEVAVLTRWP